MDLNYVDTTALKSCRIIKVNNFDSSWSPCRADSTIDLSSHSYCTATINLKYLLKIFVTYCNCNHSYFFI